MSAAWAPAFLRRIVNNPGRLFAGGSCLLRELRRAVGNWSRADLVDRTSNGALNLADALDHLALEHLLDKASNATANRRRQRVEPILTQKWLRLGRCDSLFHGVTSWRLAGRLLG